MTGYFFTPSCTPEDATKISMTVSGASDGSGSELAKYLFFVDNNSNNATQIDADSTGRKTYSYTTTTGYHTCHVSAVDKAGNVSATKSFAEGRTKLYAYEIYEYGKALGLSEWEPMEHPMGYNFTSFINANETRREFVYTAVKQDEDGCLMVYGPVWWRELKDYTRIYNPFPDSHWYGYCEYTLFPMCGRCCFYMATFLGYAYCTEYAQITARFCTIEYSRISEMDSTIIGTNFVKNILTNVYSGDGPTNLENGAFQNYIGLK